jgi:hypothetical protein
VQGGQGLRVTAGCRRSDPVSVAMRKSRTAQASGNEPTTGVPRASRTTPGLAGLTSFVLALARYGRCTFDPRRPALTGTCPGTLPLSTNAAGVEQP